MKIAMKYALFFLLLLGFAPFSIAQTSPKNKLFLNDGSELYGEILEGTGNIQFKLSNGQILSFDESEIAGYEDLSAELSFFEGGKTINYKGYYGVFSANFMTGNSYDYNDLPAASFEPVELIVGYAFKPWAQVGLGTSIHLLIPEQRKFIPVFIEYRAMPWKLKNSPFVALAAGYSFGLSSEENEAYKGGFNLRTTAGVTFASKGKAKFQLGLHYQLQESTEDIPFCGFAACNDNKRYISYKRFGLNLGMRF